MDEPAARRVILVRAIETADAEGKLVGLAERDEIDHAARREAAAPNIPDHTGRHFPPEQFLDLRARRVLAIVEARNPALAALQEQRSWQRWLGIGVPAAALVMGILTNFAVNPHRLDLVSLPLLGVVAWNLVVYVLLIAGWILDGRPGRKPWLAGLGRWTDGERAIRRRPGNVPSQAASGFFRHWFAATQQLHVQRSSRVLHAAAAAWAVGVILSLLLHGLVVQYKVGWESTFLSGDQVHSLLEVLRWPALLLFPMPPFSPQDVANLHFSTGGGAGGGRQWAFMYVALLLVVVVIPRLVLAAWAFVRERMLAAHVPVDLTEPYYERIVSLLSTTRVQLAVVTHRDEDRAALMRLLVQEADITSTLISTDHGDVLRFIDLSGRQAPAASPENAAGIPPWQRWFKGILGGHGAGAPSADPGLDSAREDTDVVLHVARGGDDIAAAGGLVEWLGKPVLVLGDSGGRAKSLPFDHFARSWVQERILFDAISGLLPAAKVSGFARLAKAWDDRNQARFGRSMSVVADHLMFAAKQTEEVHGSALTVRSVLYSEREAQASSRQVAMDAIVQRIDASCAGMFARLRELHGIDESAAQGLQHHLEQKFIVQQSIDTPQAGLAGAATGAAMGASVDLLTGGLTLGAAAALGAVIGGGAAFATAAWKNRATASGSTLVQLSDEMMQALVEAALLRYLAVAHYGRTPLGEGLEPAAPWRSEVVAAVEADKTLLLPFWTASRTQPHAARLASALAQQLEAIAMKVLVRINS